MSAVLETTQPSLLKTIRELLHEWTRYRRGWRPDNGYPHAVPWINQIRGHVDGWTEGDDYDLRIRAVQMRHVDEAIKALPGECQHAIAVVYLNEIGPAVWRSARKPMAEIRIICERAEVLLIPALRRRDVI